jgi:hypothetical protein
MASLTNAGNNGSATGDDATAISITIPLPIGMAFEGNARCEFSDRNLHSMMPLDPTHVRLKLCHACD